MARDAVSEIRERIDIVDLIQGYVPSLKRAGRSSKGLCPFHQEKTPSFVVFPDSQNFHCFGCGKGGDLFTFYMLVEHVEFREALLELASRAGLTLDNASPVNPEHDAHRNRLAEINELAVTFFRHVLNQSPEGAPGRSTVESRQISDDMVDRFALGFAPDSWDRLLTFLRSRNVDPEAAFEAGLLQKRESGGFYDRFRNRFMFPIRDRSGHVAGFGGRVVGDAQPKYLNTPQTPIFDKSSLVYGLDLASEAIRKSEEVVIVEGYMDVIAAHQFGYENVVASMGTALTEPQVGQIKRSAKRIVLALDADAAGQIATIRGLETMRGALDTDETPVPDAMGIVRFEQKLKTEISIVTLPDGKDPDQLIRESPARWPELVANARPFMDFTIETLTSGISISDPRAKSEIVARVAPLLRQIPDRIVQGHYISMLAKRLDLEERLVLSETRRTKLGERPRASRLGLSSEAKGRVARRSTEDYVVALLVKHPDLTRDITMRIPVEELTDVRNQEIIRVLRDEEVSKLPPEQIVLGLDDHLADHAEALLESLQGRPEQFPGQIQREATQMLAKLGKERFDFLMKQLDATLQTALQDHDAAALETIKLQIGALAERHRQYYPPPSPYFLDTRSNQSR